MFLVDVIVPVVLVAGAGFLFARLTRFDVTPLTKLSFYVLAPAMIYHSLQHASISEAMVLNVGLFVFLVHGALLLLAGLGVRWTHWDGDTRVSAMMSLSFANCGNYGLPILLFAFGEPGFVLGIVYMVAHQVFQIVFGVPLASWRRGMSLPALTRQLLTVPWLYAVILGMAARAASFELPAAVGRGVELVADALIPVQLLLLGMALAGAKLGRVARQAAPIAIAKMIAPPLLAWGTAAALGLTGVLRAALILEASTPTAINALILSLQYNRRPDLTASVVLLTTIGGVGTTALLLWLLA